jgi:hypothetical protein
MEWVLHGLFQGLKALDHGGLFRDSTNAFMLLLAYFFLVFFIVCIV